jgi:protein TonB
MLDQLVESRNTSGENTRKGGFLLTTLVIMSVILVSAWMYSLFAKDYAMGGSDLELTTLVAPPVVDDAPEPEPEKQPEQKAPNVDVRTEIIQSMMESPKPPKEISVSKNTIPPRDPNKYTVKGDRNFSAENAPPPDYKGPVNTGGSGSNAGGNGGDGGADVGGGAPPPPPAPKPKPPPKQISGGVLNGKATSLPKPAYPAAARSMHISGTVVVQVLIDEDGNVVSASAASGHPLLKAAAVSAARRAKFSPTKLSGQPVKVSGVIRYNFAP